MGTLQGRAPQGGGTDVVEATTRGGEGIVTAVASALALVFSAYTLYDTNLRRPDLRAFVPPVIGYSQPGNSSFEVFEVPVTVANLGGRAGTVLSMGLEVENPRNKAVRKFYSGELGRLSSGPAIKRFAPISLPGKSSSSDTVLFYSRDDEKEDRIADQKKGNYLFRLSLNVAMPEDLGMLDRFWSVKPEPVAFTMEMPEVDHRAFDNGGTMELHALNWRGAGQPGPASGASDGGSQSSADANANMDETKTNAARAAAPPASGAQAKAQEAAMHDALVEELKAKCKEASPGAKLSSASTDLKSGVSASADYVCPDAAGADLKQGASPSAKDNGAAANDASQGAPDTKAN